MKTRRKINGISAGLLLIGLGVISCIGWSWQGIMIVLGLSLASGLVFRGKNIEALITALIFIGIPVLAENDLPWNIFAPMILIGSGIIVLGKALIVKDEDAAKENKESR